MRIDRIQKNEERLDLIRRSMKNLEEAFSDFVSHQKDLAYLNKYYGSQNWFQDKDAFEQGKIPRIKAGVLSEDAVWNLNEEIQELKQEMKKFSQT